MKFISFKDGVVLDRVALKLIQALPTIHSVFEAYGYATTVTSGREGDHMATSKHTQRIIQALDFRTWENSRGIQISDARKVEIAASLRLALNALFPNTFDVVVEWSHIHIEIDEREL